MINSSPEYTLNGIITIEKQAIKRNHLINTTTEITDLRSPITISRLRCSNQGSQIKPGKPPHVDQVCADLLQRADRRIDDQFGMIEYHKTA